MSHVGSAQDTEDELLQAFRVFDKDNSGTISASEMRDVLKALGEDLTDKEINEIMQAADTDGDKSIDCESLPCQHAWLAVADLCDSRGIQEDHAGSQAVIGDTCAPGET